MATAAEGFPIRPRQFEKRGGTSQLPSGATPTVLRRSPPKRASSPDEGARSRVSLGQSASGGAHSTSGSTREGANSGSGPLVMSVAGSGLSNYGSGNYGSGSYGSGSYTTAAGGHAAPKAKSPCRASIVATANRASPPRALTPRTGASSWKPQPRVVSSAGGLPYGGGGGSLGLPPGGGASSAAQHDSVTPRQDSTASALQGLGVTPGGSLNVGPAGVSGGSLSSSATLPSWPSPPRNSTFPRGASPALGQAQPRAAAGDRRQWHHSVQPAAAAAASVGLQAAAGRSAVDARTGSASPVRAASSVPASSAGIYRR